MFLDTGPGAGLLWGGCATSNNKSQRSDWGVGNDPMFLPPHRRGCEAGSGMWFLGRDGHQGASVDGRVARKKKRRRRRKGAFVERTHLAAEHSSGCRELLSMILMVGEYPCLLYPL